MGRRRSAVLTLAFVYGVLKWEEAKMPLVLMAVGVALSVLGRVIQAA